MTRNRREAARVGKAIENFHRLSDEFGGHLDGYEQYLEFKRRLGDESRAIGRDSDEIKRLANICRRCGDPGHWSSSCPTIVCNDCGQGGHRARRCPNKATS